MGVLNPRANGGGLTRRPLATNNSGILQRMESASHEHTAAVASREQTTTERGQNAAPKWGSCSRRSGGGAGVRVADLLRHERPVPVAGAGGPSVEARRSREHGWHLCSLENEGRGVGWRRASCLSVSPWHHEFLACVACLG